MKKRNKWKIWLSDAILKHRRTYAGKKRIVNTLCLSFLLLYGGSALGLAQRSAGFVGWTVFLTICGIGDAVYVYYLAVTRSYEVVEGTVSEIHAELFFDGFNQMGLLPSCCLTKEPMLCMGNLIDSILIKMHMHFLAFTGWTLLLILEIFLAWRR